MAQFGRALRSGRRGRRFKSCRIDWQDLTATIHLYIIIHDAWLSLVERCVRDAEAAGSNPVASTTKKEAVKFTASFFAS